MLQCQLCWPKVSLAPRHCSAATGQGELLSFSLRQPGKPPSLTWSPSASAIPASSLLDPFSSSMRRAEELQLLLLKGREAELPWSQITTAERLQLEFLLHIRANTQLSRAAWTECQDSGGEWSRAALSRTESLRPSFLGCLDQAFPRSSATAGKGNSLQHLDVLVWALNSFPLHPGLSGLCPFFAKAAFRNPFPICNSSFSLIT